MRFRDLNHVSCDGTETRLRCVYDEMTRTLAHLSPRCPGWDIRPPKKVPKETSHGAGLGALY